MKKIFLTTTAILSLSATANAQEHHHHHGHDHSDDGTGWHGHLDARTYATSIYEANESEEEVSYIFTHSHIEGGYRFGNGFSVNGGVILEGDPAGHSHGGGASRAGDHFFDDHPLYIEELTLNYDDEHFGGYVGKFTPELGRDPHNVPGWWGMLVFEEFQIREQLGFGGYLQSHGQKLDVSISENDTSFLQQSILYNRDNAVDNQDGLSNYSVNLSGDLGVPYASYYMGYGERGFDNAGEYDEDRFVFGLSGNMDIMNAVNIALVGDVTDIDHLNGEADHDRTYYTIGANATYNQWVMGGSFTGVDNKSADEVEGMNGQIIQTSIGYNFTPNLGVDGGWVSQTEEGETSNRYGALLRYHTEF